MDPTPKEAAEMLAKQKGGKKGGKAKPKVMHLSEFQSTASSWADEVGDLPSGPSASSLPTGPSSSSSSFDSDGSRSRDDDYRGQRRSNFGEDRRSNYGEDRDRRSNFGGDDRERRSNFGDDRGSRRDDDGARQPRPRGELIEKRGYQIDTNARPHKTNYPTNPPFKLYLGNLSFRATNDDIIHLLSGCKVLDIKIPETEGRSRGFAYVEVDSIQAIHHALEMNGAIVQDRTVIIDLADVPTDQRDWRQRDSAPSTTSSGFRDDRRSNPDGRGPRDFGNREPREFNREPREFNREPREPPRSAKSDEINDWRVRTDNPAPLTHREERADRPERVDRPDRFERSERSERPRFGFSRGGDQERPPQESSQPSGERPKLELKPRSEGASASSQDRPQKSNPFGQAKPRDEAEAQRKVEERRKQREAEQKAASPPPAGSA